MKPLAAVILAVAMLTGCSTYAASRYSISADTVRTLREYRGQTVNVGAFTAAESNNKDIVCRAFGPIKTPDGETFEQFVRKAFIDELTIADLLSAGAPVTLTGRLDAIDFTSHAWRGAWTIGLTVTSSNGRRMSVVEEYEFTSSFLPEVACNQTAHALMPAVQNLVGKTVRHQDFRALIQPVAR